MSPQTATTTERHEELQAGWEAAKAELNEVRQRAHEHRNRIEGHRVRLLELTITSPEEFSETGSPRKGSAAAKMASEIEKLAEADDFESAIHGAEGRVERARLALRGHVEGAARELLGDFDGGARKPMPEARDPGEAHNDFLLELIRQRPQGGGGQW